MRVVQTKMPPPPVVTAIPVDQPATPSPESATTEATGTAGAAMSDAEKREALIRIAAYSFYERRGFVGGHELEDWLQAEMEVERQLAAAKEAEPAK